MGVAIAMAVYAGIKYMKTPARASTSGYVQEFDQSLFEANVLNSKPGQTWVVDFWATWCGPCRQFAPEFDATADKLNDRISFGRVEVDGAPELAQRFGVHVIPTVIMFKDGRVVATGGGMYRDRFEQWITSQL
jgi:thioredoxin